jgi:serine/threonine protein kinase
MSESLIGYILSCLQVWFGPRVTFSEEKITICLTTKIIGEGSYSNVIKAIDINNFRKYAVKKILVQSTDAEQNIHNEIEALSRFKHSNILPCIAHKYSVDMKKGMKVVYLVFPFVRQGNLRQILNSTLKNEIKPLGIRYILRYFYDIASAISVLHASSPSYVHNDIKPEVSLGDQQYL